MAKLCNTKKDFLNHSTLKHQKSFYFIQKVDWENNISNCSIICNFKDIKQEIISCILDDIDRLTNYEIMLKVKQMYNADNVPDNYTGYFIRKDDKSYCLVNRQIKNYFMMIYPNYEENIIYRYFSTNMMQISNRRFDYFLDILEQYELSDDVKIHLGNKFIEVIYQLNCYNYTIKLSYHYILIKLLELFEPTIERKAFYKIDDRGTLVLYDKIWRCITYELYWQFIPSLLVFNINIKKEYKRLNKKSSSAYALTLAETIDDIDLADIIDNFIV